jgi:hypothetical protein
MEAIKSREQIASEYNVDVRTIHRWIQKKLSELIGITLTPRYQKMIYKEFGYPPCVNPDDYAYINI